MLKLMQLIGITGAIGHGKSSLADALQAHEPQSVHLESFYIIAEVAEALHGYLKHIPATDDLAAINAWLTRLPKVLEEVIHLTGSTAPALTAEAIAAEPALYDKLFLHLHNLRQQPELLTQKITDQNKPLYRPILQWLGGFITTQLDDQAWYRELVRRAQQAGQNGTRLAVIGGLRFPTDALVIKEAGGTIIKIERPGAAQPDLRDPTERERESIIADSTVVNNGDLADLSRLASRLLDDLAAGQLQQQYQALQA